MLGNASERVKHADGGNACCSCGNRRPGPLYRHSANGEHRNRRRGSDRSQGGEPGGTAAAASTCLEDGAEDEVIDPLPPAVVATASGTLWTERPMRNGAGTHARTRRAANESPRRCTPWAPAASATSRRSLTRMRVRVPRTASTHAGHEARQRAALEIALADLHEVHAGARRGTHARDERRLPG